MPKKKFAIEENEQAEFEVEQEEEIKQKNSLEGQVLTDESDSIKQELHLGEVPERQARAHIKRHASLLSPDFCHHLSWNL